MFEIKKPCQNCKSFILKPKKKVELNLKNIVKNTKEQSFEVLAFTGSMLSLKKKCKINIYNYIDDNPFYDSGQALYKWSPVADDLKILDKEIVLNSIKNKWNTVINEFNSMSSKFNN